MPPKKEVMGVDTPKLLSSFEDKETKLLAAAFLSSLGPDKVSDNASSVWGHARVACLHASAITHHFQYTSKMMVSNSFTVRLRPNGNYHREHRWLAQEDVASR
jgi:hypothetical protein